MDDEVEALRSEETVNRVKLQRSIQELASKAELAEVDRDIAKNELDNTLIELHASTGGPFVTPKEEEYAHIKERQRYLDLLDARLQLVKAQVSFLRQTGGLEQWLQSTGRPELNLPDQPPNEPPNRP